MATNFSPCKGSYVLNQFPSNVMFGMNGFHVSASGAIQGHHGPLVSSLGLSTLYSIDPRFYASTTAFENIVGKKEIACNEQFLLFPKCFLFNQKIISPFVNIYDIISLFTA